MNLGQEEQRGLGRVWGVILVTRWARGAEPTKRTEECGQEKRRCPGSWGQELRIGEDELPVKAEI